jgi:hypothetical protein
LARHDRLRTGQAYIYIHSTTRFISFHGEPLAHDVRLQALGFQE